MCIHTQCNFFVKIIGCTYVHPCPYARTTPACSGGVGSFVAAVVVGEGSDGSGAAGSGREVGVVGAHIGD
jgi:hypothetical protein